LDRGEYGTLGTQLNAGYTPFVAMLAPREEYIVENLFQGYVERGVLEQALFDLVASDVRATRAMSRCSSTLLSSLRAGAA